jgi:uncharacterized membrane protein YgdD (TMEM256/DUF423 family)
MIWIRLGSILAALGVMMGAFGAHGLKSKLTPELMEIYKTAAFYHLIHALAIVLVGILAAQRTNFPSKPIALLFAIGILFFSGSLYALTMTNIRALGAITPIGGVCFIAAWILLAVKA